MIGYKKLAAILFLLCFTSALLPLQVSGASVSEIEQKTRDVRKTASSDDDDDNNGGYKKSKEIFDRHYEFVQKKFTREDFDEWLELLHTARACEYFMQLTDEETIGKDGEVLTKQLTLGNNRFNRGSLITIGDVTRYFRDIITTQTLLGQLQGLKIIDANGYLTGSDTFPADFEQIDFGFLQENLQGLYLGLRNQTLHAELVRELSRYMINESRIVAVKQRETTTYHSNKEGFLEQLGDYILGSIVGSVLFPDRVETVKQKETWNPSLSVYNFFPFTPGFNWYPYRGGKGMLIVNGKNRLSRVDAAYTTSNGLKNYSIELTNKHLISGPRGSDTSAAGFGVTGLEFTQIYDNQSALGFASGYLGFGVTGERFMGDILFGLAYKSSESHSGLGLMVGGDISYLPFHPFSLNWNIRSYSQPNLINDTTNWLLVENKVSLGVHLFSLYGNAGYKWIGTSASGVLDNWYLSAGWYF